MKRKICIAIVLIAAVLLAYGRGKGVLFIGDSITDGAWGNSKVWNTPSEDRNERDMNHIYGHGYMMICASHYQGLYPTDSFTFWNRGISGNTLDDLRMRWHKDAVNLHPDVISILIGTNDADRCLRTGTRFDIKAWEETYRHLLDSTLTALPDVRFVLCTPFVAETGKLKGSKTFSQRAKIISAMDSVVRTMADDYNAVLVPFDTLFSELHASSPSETYWIWDGIHPTPAAHYRMSQLWIEKADRLLNVGNEKIGIQK